LPVRTQIRPVAGSGKVLTSQASPVSGSARYVATAPRKRWLIGGGQGLTRRLGMDREDPRCGPVRDDRSRNQAGR